MAPLIWLIVGLALTLAEFVVPGFVIFFFGLGGLLNALLVWLLPHLTASIPVQILTWLALSAASLFGFRRYLARWFKGSRFIASDAETEFVGSTATVLERVSPESPGRIEFRGTTWPAITFDRTFAPGEKVEILKRDGMKFIVTESVLGLPRVPPEERGDEDRER